jgi:ParB family transcriptional regulator, chromosome partitioning protein
MTAPFCGRAMSIALQMNGHFCNAKRVRCAGPDCRKSFTPERSTRRFCSTRCRVARHRADAVELARNEWWSPSEIVEAARRVMGGIDLDPASCPQANETVRATRFYTVKEDGLRQQWSGKVWLNPPYGRVGPKFIAKLAESYRSAALTQACLILASNHQHTKWFSSLTTLKPIKCSSNGRLKFSGKGSPKHGSVVLGIGVDRDAFGREFARFGEVWTPYGNAP